MLCLLLLFGREEDSVYSLYIYIDIGLVYS